LDETMRATKANLNHADGGGDVGDAVAAVATSRDNPWQTKVPQKTATSKRLAMRLPLQHLAAPAGTSDSKSARRDAPVEMPLLNLSPTRKVLSLWSNRRSVVLNPVADTPKLATAAAVEAANAEDAAAAATANAARRDATVKNPAANENLAAKSLNTVKIAAERVSVLPVNPRQSTTTVMILSISATTPEKILLARRTSLLGTRRLEPSSTAT